jgi:hypothetical protein
VVPTNRLFSSKRSQYQQRHYSSSTSQHQQQRDFPLTIRATAEECQALAKRFELTQLQHLQADVMIRPSMTPWNGKPSGTSGSTGTNPAVMIVPVEVEGTIQATVTQTCVRSNEHFEVQVEFPFYVVVKPIRRESMFDGMAAMDLSNDDNYHANRYTSSPPINNATKKKPKRRNNHRAKQQQIQSFNLDDFFELQTAREVSTIGTTTHTTTTTFDAAVTAAATMVEDPSIYSSATGILDVGELVAQTFWLQLDPFPKKPGTRPVQMEISG